MQDKLRELGLTPTGTSAAHLEKNMAADYDYWGRIVRGLNIKLE